MKNSEHEKELSADEILEALPDVAMSNLSGINSYYIKTKKDLDKFSKEIEYDDLWTNKSDDDIKDIIPQLLALGLKHTVTDFLGKISQPRINPEFYGSDNYLTKEMRVMLYRCIRELVNNIVKHANAEYIFVKLSTHTNNVSVVVHDNGTGFDPESVTIGLGLGNIANYIISQNGIMAIHTEYGKNTEINLNIELNHD